MLNVVIEIFAKETESAEYRLAGHVDEGTVPFVPIEIDDLLKMIKERPVAFALLDAFKHRRDHRSLHATRRALTTRLAGEELRDARSLFHHARPLRVETHDATAQCRAGAME